VPRQNSQIEEIRMSALEGRTVVVGVTGGVSAYKAIELCRELMRRGAHVVPVMTEGAQRFIGAATFSALASEPVRTSLWDSPEASPHTDLGQRADLVVVAPATANFLAAARIGNAGDLLTATVLATRAPLVIAPAMHTEMWEQPATQDNVSTLAARGVTFVGPIDGELAGGDVGMGRLAPPTDIADACAAVLAAQAPVELDLAGLRVLVSAGGTREPIDPVRYIGNRSSGKQGHAIAAAARRRGASVELVTASMLDTGALRSAGVDVEHVDTAAQMYEAMLRRSGSADVVVMSAAVADFRPVDPLDAKLKRRDGVPRIQLEPNPVILDALVAGRSAGQTIVGFAAETSHLREYASAKLESSCADLVVANDVAAPGAGFEHDTNAVTILGARGLSRDIELCGKDAVADAVLDAVLDVRAAEPPAGWNTNVRELKAHPHSREAR
jgi:phosphopantothenoylcysteine decarboxylase/phosphopantothenate--cysteine ligase